MKNINLFISFIAGILILIIPATAVSQDWSQWRGVNRDGKVTGFNVPTKWPKELTQNWKVTVGFGDASPVLVGQKLYVFTRQHDNEILRCLDANSGKEMWKDSYVTDTVIGPPSSHPGPRSTPTVADGKVVTLGVNGIISCLDANTGKLLWRNDDYTAELPQFYTGMSPIIVDGLCIAQLGGAVNGKIIAFDLATGNIKWNCEDHGPSYASPILVIMDGKKHIIFQTDKNLLAVSKSEGKIQWQIPTTPEKRFYNSASPISDGQKIIYTGQGTGTRAVKIQKQDEGFGVSELWHNPELGTSYNTPVLREGHLYGLNEKGKLFCIDAQTGQTAWADTSMHKTFGAILDAGPVMIALPSSSELVVYKPDANAYAEIIRYKVADTPVYAHPILSGKRIYIKDYETLIMWTVD
jgi:outer membrane protein assembly factor BamB